MTDDQLLKNIRSIVSEEVKKETVPLAKNLNLLTEKVDTVEKRLGSVEKNVGTLTGNVDSLTEKVDSIEKRQKRHGKKIGFLTKSVEIIGRVYDERIVENWQEIKKIKTHLGLPINH